MKKDKGVTLISLVVLIIILIILAGININTLVGENGIITKAKQAKQNITLAGEAEALQLNQLYYELETGGELAEEIIALLQKQVEELQNQVSNLQTENEDLKQQIADLTNQIGELQTELESLRDQISQKDMEITDLKTQITEKQEQIENLQSQLDSINSLVAQTNATEDTILAGYKAYSGGQLLTGTMANRGAISSNLNCGQSYTIPAGYHNGSGKVTANSLASQTAATATASDILTGKTAWVNGTKITGTASLGSNISISRNVASSSQCASLSTSLAIQPGTYIIILTRMNTANSYSSLSSNIESSLVDSYNVNEVNSGADIWLTSKIYNYKASSAITITGTGTISSTINDYHSSMLYLLAIKIG